MRRGLVLPCCLATFGLFFGGGCAMLTSANGDIGNPIDIPSALVAGCLAWAGIVMILLGGLLSSNREQAWRWASCGFLIVGAVLSWAAFVLGYRACLELGSRYTSSGPFIMTWLAIFWLPGVLPATVAALRVFTRRIWNADNHPAAR